MGGDGGSITTRADMVKTKGYRFLRNLGGMGYVPNTQVREGDERFSRSEGRDLQLSTCSLSQEPLRLPIVACRLGRLYNKEELLSRLLNKSMPPHMQHVSSLKDVQQCVTEINQDTHFLVCPVSRVDIRSGVKASIIWPCGCIISDKARRAAATAAVAKGEPPASSPSTSHEKNRDHSEEKLQNVSSRLSSLPGADSACSDPRPACVHCGQRYDPEEDLIPLLPEEEELEKLQEKLRKHLEAKRAAKQAKKSRTAISTSYDAASSSSTNGTGSSTMSDNGKSEDSSTKSPDRDSSNIGKTSIASVSESCSNSSSSTTGDHKGSINHNRKSGELHPAVVAPCATSTRLQAESFKWLRPEDDDEEKQHKRKHRDWVLSNSKAVEDIVGTLKAPRLVKPGAEHTSARM